MAGVNIFLVLTLFVCLSQCRFLDLSPIRRNADVNHVHQPAAAPPQHMSAPPSGHEHSNDVDQQIHNYLNSHMADSNSHGQQTIPLPHTSQPLVTPAPSHLAKRKTKLKGKMNANIVIAHIPVCKATCREASWNGMQNSEYVCYRRCMHDFIRFIPFDPFNFD